MSEDKIISFLGNHKEVAESYVLLRELKVYLNVGHSTFNPCIRIKLWKSGVHPQYPYHFTVSHHVHTPTQAGPYYPSRTQAASETEAITEAISTTTSFLKSAIQEGHEPSQTWLVPNNDF